MARSQDSSAPAPRASLTTPARALLLGAVGAFPPGPHPDGLIGVDDDMLTWYWDAPANAWLRLVRN